MVLLISPLEGHKVQYKNNFRNKTMLRDLYQKRMRQIFPENLNNNTTYLNVKPSPRSSTSFGSISNIPVKSKGCPPNAYSV